MSFLCQEGHNKKPFGPKETRFNPISIHTFQKNLPSAKGHSAKKCSTPASWGLDTLGTGLGGGGYPLTKRLRPGGVSALGDGVWYPLQWTANPPVQADPVRPAEASQRSIFGHTKTGSLSLSDQLTEKAGMLHPP